MVSREDDEGSLELPAGDVESAQAVRSEGGWVGRASGGRKGDLGPRGGPGPGRRVVARGVRRKKIDDRMLIAALLMIAKDLDQDHLQGGKDPS